MYSVIFSAMFVLYSSSLDNTSLHVFEHTSYDHLHNTCRLWMIVHITIGANVAKNRRAIIPMTTIVVPALILFLQNKKCLFRLIRLFQSFEGTVFSSMKQQYDCNCNYPYRYRFYRKTWNYWYCRCFWLFSCLFYYVEVNC